MATTRLAERARFDLVLYGTLLVLTWGLMILGALTRASGAGISCPDWPLCHGHLVPPLDAALYPADPRDAVYKVFLEFIHRVLAGLVSMGSLVLGIRLLRRGRPRPAILLWTVLALQIAMGAVTVILRNAPFTVVIHLGLALTFSAVLIYSARTTLGFVPALTMNTAYRVALALVATQLLLGGVVSSRAIGLACYDFPFCNGLPLPAYWTNAIGWQFAHRMTGFTIFAVLSGTALVARFGRETRERAFAYSLVAVVSIQILLGGINVWFRIPPIASAAHLAVAVLLFAALVDRTVRGISVST